MPSKRLLDELMRYIEFSTEDAALMHEMGPLLRPHFPAVVDHFYQAIDRTPGATAVFTGGAEQIARQKVMLHGWLEGLVGGVYDEQYVERRARIGRTHVRIALDQRYMFAGMNVVRAELHEGLDTRAGWPLDKLRAGHRAIDRLCDMELAIMLETYREAYIARVKDAERLATIGQVAASIGHELRNPLAVMQTSVQLLARRLPDEERTSKHLRRLCEQITLCNEIISDLLELARDRAPERRPTDLAAVVQEAATSVPRPPEVTLTLQIDAGLPTVAVDPGQFRQLVINLVLNATQAIEGAGRIELRLQALDHHLVLVVQDTGSGISAEAEARLFEPLFTTRSTGTGLGLALCRRITEKHSGSISATNHADGGASFVVRVPLTGPEVLSAAGLLRVLVVDDNRQLAENLAELLSDEGCSVCTAFSAEEALRAAADAHFDLVLTDIRMPGMNGVELVRLLAQREPTATYLLMTAYTSDQVLSAASHLGVVRAVLAKPLAVERLLELLPRRSGVLLVEDDRRLALLLEESLRRGGYTVHVSATCEGAQEALQRARPDIAVIDCTLPGGAGMAFARQLCAGAGDEARRGWIPLIVFSGRETEAELRSATPSAIQFVNAPVSAESLLSALAQIKPEGKP